MLRRLAVLGLVGMGCLAPRLGAQTPRELFGLLAAGDSARLEPALAAALAAPPGNGTVHLAVAQIRLQQRRYTTAAAAAQRALTGDSIGEGTRGWVTLALGEATFMAGDTAAARAALTATAANRNSVRAAARATGLLRLLGLDSVYAGWRIVESEHLRIHLPPDTRVADPAAWAASRERALAGMQAFFDVKLPKKIDIVVWPSREAAAAAGFNTLGFTRPEYAVTHTLMGQTPGHELVHTVEWLAGGGPPPERKTRLVNEGTAVVFDGTARDLLAAARAGMRTAGYSRISLAALWGDLGATPEEVMYPVAGLTVRRLIERGGHDRFLRFLADQRLDNARALYGDLLTQVITEVEKELNAS